MTWNLASLAVHCAADLVERQRPDGWSQISFDSKPIDKLWLVGRGCDFALTLMAVADGTA